MTPDGRPPLTGTVVALAVALLLCVGVWHLGHGAWIHVKAAVAQKLLQRAWARTAAGEAHAKPWPWADFWPVARLQAPDQRADLIVLAGVSGRALAFGPGHAPGTAVPGDGGTAIVSAHRDTHFRFLERLRPDDEILVDLPGRVRTRFVVRETAVVDARVAAIRDGDGPATLVLVTCYPFDALTPGGPLRYIVVAERAER